MNWSPEEIELLTEDFHLSSVGRFIISVGWFPARDINGAFLCRVILDGNWKEPFEELKTKDPEKMMHWVVHQMKEAARRGKSMVSRP